MDAQVLAHMAQQYLAAKGRADAAPADGWPGEWTEEAEIPRVASAGYPFPRHDGRAYVTQVGDGWGKVFVRVREESDGFSVDSANQVVPAN